jgi:hypothetical protein
VGKFLDNYNRVKIIWIALINTCFKKTKFVTEFIKKYIVSLRR